MKLISWNVNGFRAVLQKGFAEVFEKLDADIFCLQETKMQPDQAQFNPPGYEAYWYSAVRKGYSGTALFTRVKPLRVSYGLGIEQFDCEGRLICAEYETFYLVCVYAPNSQAELTRLPFRMQWEDALREYLCRLDAQKPVLLCGDLNVAHTERDLKNPKPNRGSAGFTDEERAKMGQLLDAGFTDSFRSKYPAAEGCYTWWSYRFKARQNNAGWRIDYFLVSSRAARQIEDAVIYSDITGSDHCPVGLLWQP